MTNPDRLGEYPYDPTEMFSADELAAARQLRESVGPVKVGDRIDSCPHTPACLNVYVCIEEIAWYLRHKSELDIES